MKQSDVSLILGTVYLSHSLPNVVSAALGILMIAIYWIQLYNERE